MARSRTSQRQASRRAHQQKHALRLLVRIAALIFVSLSALAVVFAIVATSGASSAQNAGNQPPANQPVVVVSIKSTDASDIIAAVKQTTLYQTSAQADDLIGRALRSGHLANPVLVKPYRNDVGLGEYWVIPVVNQNNIPMALLNFTYDPVQKQIGAADFAAVTNNMFYTAHSFPAISPTVALDVIARQQHASIRVGQQPELIYFPGDRKGFLQGKNHWNGGGTTVIDPIWRIAGTDGQWHYVDHDGNAHLSTDLPVQTDYLPMPSSIQNQ